jgi:hypothetical protein
MIKAERKIKSIVRAEVANNISQFSCRMRLNNIISLILFLTLFIFACAEVENLPGNTPGIPDLDQWDIPRDQVLDGGPGKDGIPALENPSSNNASSSSYLSDADLILGYKNGTEIVAYPHRILDWHEIINDNVNGQAIAVTYCPLTGTGIGWERTINGVVTTFGVSGLLYNSNLIPYDRKTNSNWSQIRLNCVNGELRGREIVTFPLVETTWKIWRSMYPETKVISINTGFNRNYSQYPYGDYKTNNNKILFPYQPVDVRLKAKERVHGIIINGTAKAYRFETFATGTKMIEDEFRSTPLVIVGSHEKNFIVSFERILENGTELSLSLAPEQDQNSYSPIILEDQEGNKWNIFGEAVSGPRTGQKLKYTNSFMGYWFSWGAFYSGIEIFKEL